MERNHHNIFVSYWTSFDQIHYLTAMTKLEIIRSYTCFWSSTRNHKICKPFGRYGSRWNLSITLIVNLLRTQVASPMLLPTQTDIDPYTKSVADSYPTIRFIIIPPSMTITDPLNQRTIAIEKFANLFFERHKSQVNKQSWGWYQKIQQNYLSRLYLMYFFYTCMIDVANKFSVPLMVYFYNIIFQWSIRMIKTRWETYKIR